MPETLADDHLSQPFTATEQTSERERSTDGDETPSTQDALTTLRERYARGDLTDEQFKRKLSRLLQTETPENADEWRKRTDRETEIETER